MPHLIGLEARDAIRPHPGGVGRYGIELASAMQQLLQDESATESIEMLYPLRRLLQSRHKPAIPARWYGKRSPQDYAIVHATGCVFPKWRGALQIATVHDLYDYSAQDGAPVDRPIPPAPPPYIQQADRLICVSETTRSHLHELFDIPSENTVAIPLGVNPNFRPADAAAVKAYQTRAALPESYFLFIGRLRVNKNFTRLAAAYAAAKPGIPLVVAGKLSQEELQRLQQSLQQYGIAPQVICTGFVADADLPLLISGAAAVVFPSTFEGFGLPVLEAMACGVPVLTSAGVATEEVAQGHAVLVDPYSVDAIADGLTQVLAMSEAQRQAAQRYAQGCSWQKTAAATLQFYREQLS